jgi:uncharacterized lipoprotein YddW (UPF0748 family)
MIGSVTTEAPVEPQVRRSARGIRPGRRWWWCLPWCGCLVAAQVGGADAEVRGTWVTTTANTALATPEATAATMQRLREIGLNTVYIECWKNGHSEWPSEVMRRLIGVPLKVNGAPASLQRDLLKEAVTEARRNDLRAVAWLEYGFMAASADTRNELLALGESEGWITRTRDGKMIGDQNRFAWMNPLHPVPQQLLIDLSLEIVRNYPVDGVQLDDRIAMPVEMGYDDYTRALYLKETGLALPDNPRDTAFVRWRADKITAFARRYAAALRAERPDLLISASPAPFPWSYDNYCCDWPAWARFEGTERWDEFVVQNYRADFPRTRASIAEGLPLIGGRRGNLFAGIRVVGEGPDITVEDLLASIRFARESGLGGHVLWFSRGVLEVHPVSLRKFYSNTGPAVPAPGPSARPFADP